MTSNRIQRLRLDDWMPDSTALVRVRVAEDSRASFRRYWTVVRPFSGLLRRVMLRAVRRAAERRVATTR